MNASDKPSNDMESPHWGTLLSQRANFCNIRELIALLSFLYFPRDINKRSAFQHLIRSLVVVGLEELHDDIAREMRNRETGYQPKLGGRRRHVTLAVNDIRSLIDSIQYDPYRVMGVDEASREMAGYEEQIWYVGGCVDYLLRYHHQSPGAPVSLNTIWSLIDDRKMDNHNLPKRSRRSLAEDWKHFRYIAHFAYAEFALGHPFAIGNCLKDRSLGRKIFDLACDKKKLGQIWAHAFIAQKFLTGFTPQKAREPLLPPEQYLAMPEPPDLESIELTSLPEEIMTKGRGRPRKTDAQPDALVQKNNN